MKTVTMAATLALLTAAPLYAQDMRWQNAGGYVAGIGGFATSLGNTTGDAHVDGGVRIAPHLMVFGNLGRYRNLQGALQPTLDNTTTALESGQGLTVDAGGTLPAWYGMGGLRAEIPAGKHVLPYVLGGFGVARLNPKPEFTFSSGTMPDGSVPDVGTDVTTALVSEGLFTAPAASTEPMLRLGGGAQVPLSTHWMVDGGYRYSRIAASSTLSSAALNTNGLTVGFGYRF